jgi:phosphinothricin acetyltransferase
MSIRAARPADAAAIAAIYAPFVESTAVSFEARVPTVTEMQGRIEATQAKYPWLVLEEAGEIAGYAYATSHRAREAYRFSTETSVYVSPMFHRRGIGRRLYEALFGELVALRYANAFAGIALPNPASVALHEALGFESIGVFRKIGWKLGRWHDVGWWGKRLREGDPEELLLPADRVRK